MRRGILAGCLLSCFLACWPPLNASCAEEPDGLIASPEPGWPQWRGPRRDGISDETGLIQSWPEGGPPLLWKAPAMGCGYSSPILSGKRIFLSGDVEKELHIFCLDLDGKKVWEAVNGEAWRGSHPGARACLAYASGKVFHMNAHGRTACLDAQSGEELWAVDTMQRFAGHAMQWGRSECLLIDGDRVIVTPGGSDAFMAALDTNTGSTVWKSEPLSDSETQRTSYCSPILFRFQGNRLLVNASLRNLVCVDADQGRIQWMAPERSRYDANCSTPVYHAGGIYHTIPSGAGGTYVAMELVGQAIHVKQRWHCKVDNISGGAVCVAGFLYGSGETNTGWACVNAETGEMTYDSSEISQGSLLYADGRLYCLGEKGEMLLVRATPDRFDVVSRFQFVDGKGGDVWAHPVILDGRLYLRYHEILYCYDIRNQ